MSDLTALGRERRRRPSGEPPPLPMELNRAAALWLAALFVCSIVLVLAFLNDGTARWITIQDNRIIDRFVDARQSWLTTAADWIQRAGLNVVLPLIAWAVIVGCLVTKRIRRLVVFLATLAGSSWSRRAVGSWKTSCGWR